MEAIRLNNVGKILYLLVPLQSLPFTDVGFSVLGVSARYESRNGASALSCVRGNLPIKVADKPPEREDFCVEKSCLVFSGGSICGP